MVVLVFNAKQTCSVIPTVLGTHNLYLGGKVSIVWLKLPSKPILLIGVHLKRVAGTIQQTQEDVIKILPGTPRASSRIPTRAPTAALRLVGLRPTEHTAKSFNQHAIAILHLPKPSV